MPAPGTITPARWAALAATSQRMLHQHGAALHEAGWAALDLFRLHATAPMHNPPGWGLAWLLDEAGDVLEVGPVAVSMTCSLGGARLTFRRGTATGQGGFVLAWALGRME